MCRSGPARSHRMKTESKQVRFKECFLFRRLNIEFNNCLLVCCLLLSAVEAVKRRLEWNRSKSGSGLKDPILLGSPISSAKLKREVRFIVCYYVQSCALIISVRVISKIRIRLEFVSQKSQSEQFKDKKRKES